MTYRDTKVQPVPGAGLGGKYLTFALGREEYGVEIMKVREIIGHMDVTSVPGTPSYVKGVINLRGQVIGVIDLRARFGMTPAARTEATCIVVVEIFRGGRNVRAGLVVDRMCEVLNIPSDQIEEPSSFGSPVGTQSILGMGKVGGSVRILLDVDQILVPGEAVQ